MLIEACKKELSFRILLCRDKKSRLDLICYFLSYDLSKHELLEYALIMALENNESSIVEQIEDLYAHVSGDEILTAIRREIKIISRFIQTFNRTLVAPKSRSFSERRIIQEVSKYVVEQARQYTRL